MWIYWLLLQVGSREDSNIYIRNKLKIAAANSITAKHFRFDRTIKEAELKREIEKLNQDDAINGIIIQLPLDNEFEINSVDIVNTVDPSKDVDGLHMVNTNKLLNGELNDSFAPCAAKGCIELIESVDADLNGKTVVVIGKGKLVGAPTANLLRLKSAKVLQCDSKTNNLPDICRKAEVLVVAIGVPKYIKGDWIKPGSVVIDCGINSYIGKNRH